MRNQPRPDVPAHRSGSLSGRVLSRRSVLSAGSVTAAAAALSGCDLNNPFDDSTTPAADAVRDLAPDVAVAVEAVTLITGVRADLEATLAQHPSLQGRLRPFADTHAAHLSALVAAVPDRVDTGVTGTPTPVPASPVAAQRAALLRERQLHDSLIGLAMRADSGPFARLLGSMAAALSQREVVAAR